MGSSLAHASGCVVRARGGRRKKMRRRDPWPLRRDKKQRNQLVALALAPQRPARDCAWKKERNTHFCRAKSNDIIICLRVEPERQADENGAIMRCSAMYEIRGAAESKTRALPMLKRQALSCSFCWIASKKMKPRLRLWELGRLIGMGRRPACERLGGQKSQSRLPPTPFFGEYNHPINSGEGQRRP